jgi:hypothetical protein
MGASLKSNTMWRGPADRFTAQVALAGTPLTAIECLKVPATANSRVLKSHAPSQVRYNGVEGREETNSAQRIHKHKTRHMPMSATCHNPKIAYLKSTLQIITTTTTTTTTTI